MKFLANENFPMESVSYLRKSGFDIKAICEGNSGIKDHEVMMIAINEDRTILTFDRDYGELIFRLNYKPKCGVIYLRLDQYSAVQPGLIIETLCKQEDLYFENSLTVFDGETLRQRRYL